MINKYLYSKQVTIVYIITKDHKNKEMAIFIISLKVLFIVTDMEYFFQIG